MHVFFVCTVALTQTTQHNMVCSKLLDLEKEQKAKKQKDKQLLLKEYEAMVQEAEALNAMNEELVRVRLMCACLMF